MTRFREWLADCLDNFACHVWTVALRLRPPSAGPACPDCNQPEAECWCEEEYARERMLREAYDEGACHGYEEALKDGVPDENGFQW